MKLAIFLGHPAHFHLFKNVSEQLRERGHTVEFVIKQKDILEQLMQNAGYEYTVIRDKERKSNTKLGLIWSLLRMDWKMFRYLRKSKPDMLIGTYVALISKLAGIPIVITNEDDAVVVPYLALTSYPLASDILNPVSCNSGRWDKKAIKYNSYQELAYLHPNHFTPDENVLTNNNIPKDKPYFILRFAQLKAHHDSGVEGINNEIAIKIIEMLEPHGKVFITSERELSTELEPNRIKINILDMHHIMAFAQLYIGDSQTMAAESGVLGVPFVRFNDFVGKIGYLNELENEYQLGYGVKTNEVGKLYSTIEMLINMPDRQEVFRKRRERMLREKIDYAQFLTWFIENYPESAKIMKENPDFQFNFK